MKRASVAKLSFLLLLSIATAGCNEFAQVVTPTCSDEATLALVRKIVSDNIVEAGHELSADELENRLTFNLVHATKLEENIRKYTCEAILIASNGVAEHRMSLEYESQLDDAHSHLVMILNLTNGDAYVMKPILTASASAVLPVAPTAVVATETPAKVPTATDEQANPLVDPPTEDLSEQSVKPISTNYGPLSANSEGVLTFNSRSVVPQVLYDGTASTMPVAQFSVGGSDIILFQQALGNSCPGNFAYVTVSENGAKATSNFGTCYDDYTDPVLSGQSVSFSMPNLGNKGTSTFVYSNGVLLRNGAPIK